MSVGTCVLLTKRRSTNSAVSNWPAPIESKKRLFSSISGRVNAGRGLVRGAGDREVLEERGRRTPSRRSERPASSVGRFASLPPPNTARLARTTSSKRSPSVQLLVAASSDVARGVEAEVDLRVTRLEPEGEGLSRRARRRPEREHVHLRIAGDWATR